MGEIEVKKQTQVQLVPKRPIVVCLQHFENSCTSHETSFYHITTLVSNVI